MTLDDICILYIDGGTTRTRGWAAVGDTVVAVERVTVGARDTAREGTPRRLSEAFHHLARKLSERCLAQGQPVPTLAVAAGMITSAEGLANVPHVDAPAGALELAQGAEYRGLEQGNPLPIVFIPGIRSGPTEADREAIGETDVIRGEEVLSLGLACQGHLPEGGVVLNLGSHWKAMRVDGAGRVLSSVSTLAGEMLFAVRNQTILASSVARGWPDRLPRDWVAAGARRTRSDGWPRALYCVRLLEQRTVSSPEDRLAFLIGATVAANEDVLLASSGSEAKRVVLAGAPALAAAWTDGLQERGLDPVTLDEGEREAAFRAGCRAVLGAGQLTELGGEQGVAWHPPR